MGCMKLPTQSPTNHPSALDNEQKLQFHMQSDCRTPLLSESPITALLSFTYIKTVSSVLSHQSALLVQKQLLFYFISGKVVCSLSIKVLAGKQLVPRPRVF